MFEIKIIYQTSAKSEEKTGGGVRRTMMKEERGKVERGRVEKSKSREEEERR